MLFVFRCRIPCLAGSRCVFFPFRWGHFFSTDSRGNIFCSTLTKMYVNQFWIMTCAGDNSSDRADASSSSPAGTSCEPVATIPSSDNSNANSPRTCWSSRPVELQSLIKKEILSSKTRLQRLNLRTAALSASLLHTECQSMSDVWQPMSVSSTLWVPVLATLCWPLIVVSASGYCKVPSRCTWTQ